MKRWLSACAVLWIGVLSGCGEDGGSTPITESTPSAMPDDARTAGPAKMDAGLPASKVDGGRVVMDEPPPVVSAEDGLPARGRPPRVQTRITVRLVSPAGVPHPNVSVHARGRPVVTDAAGFAQIDEVFGEAKAADVFVASATPLLGGHIRVPLSPGRAEHQALVVIPEGEDAPLTRALTDLSAPLAIQETADLESGEPLFAMEAPAGALRTSWDAVPSGAGHVHYQVARSQHAALWAPGGLLLDTDAGPVPLDATAMFQVGARQGGSYMELGEAADVTVSVLPHARAVLATGAADAGVPSAMPMRSLYRFDRARGRFVMAGSASLESSSGGAPIVRARITRMGFYVVGAPAAPDGCQRIRFEDAAGAPVAHGAVRAGAEGTGQALWLDEQGSACLPGPAERDRPAMLFGVVGAAVMVFATATLRPQAAPMGCGATCASAAAVTGSTVRMTCVTASFGGSPSAFQVRVEDADGEAVPVGPIARDVHVCLQVPAGATLTLSDTEGYTCPEPIVLGTGVGACGSSACQDLGAMRCCGDRDRCFDGQDNDCDGQVDEGCFCDQQCDDTGRPPCCTAAGTCGVAPLSDDAACIDGPSTDFSLGTGCPDELLATDGATNLVPGCCLYDGRCGFLPGGNGCIPRELLHEHIALPAPLSAQACTP